MTKKEEKQAAAEVKKMGQKGGRGTHGSLTKAGKVREQTPKIEKTNLAKHTGPSVTNRKRFKNFGVKKHKEEFEQSSKKKRMP
jgi:ribosomal protein S30